MSKSWFDIKIRALLGHCPTDEKEIVILGRIVRYQNWGIEYEADPKHMRLLLEKLGLNEGSSSVGCNGE